MVKFKGLVCFEDSAAPEAGWLTIFAGALGQGWVNNGKDIWLICIIKLHLVFVSEWAYTRQLQLDLLH